ENKLPGPLAGWQIGMVGALLLLLLAGGRVEAAGLGDTAPSTGGATTQAPASGPGTASWPNLGKRIDVNLSTQTLVAYQGSLRVFMTRISSGVAKHPTLTGTFHVYAKLKSQRMTGGVGREHYDLPNVPNVMYFFS